MGLEGSVRAAGNVEFSQVKPILESACLSCHGPEKPKGGLRLDTRAAAITGGDNGTSLVPGKPEESLLYTLSVLPPDDDDVMPPKGDPLNTFQKKLFKQWIEEGAVWPEEAVLQTVKRIDFVKDVQPILEFNCVACHREKFADGEFRLDTEAMALTSGRGGVALIPGNAAKSALYTTTILPADDITLMPPVEKGGPLSEETTDTLRDWINQGASWPEGLTLTPKKVAQTPAMLEADLVSRIHWKVVTNLTMTLTPGMNNYKETIPGPDVEFEMVVIPGGEFMMGSPEAEAGHKPDEGAQHRVYVDPFWMGKCEVTWNEFELFMYPQEEKQRTRFLGNTIYTNTAADAVTRPTKPYVEMSFGMGKDGFPAISMTQHAANKYCEWLSAKTGRFYRLPTEAEWEYACRAGTTTAYSFGDDSTKIGEYAWYGKNSDWKYQKVGTKKPNPWGLHDMHGNVLEWTLDQYDPEYYKMFAGMVVTNPWNRATAPYPHVARGGSWDDDDPAKLRSAARRGSDPSWKQQDPQLPKSIWFLTDAQFLGFRVIRPLRVPPPEELSKYWTSGVETE